MTPKEKAKELFDEFLDLMDIQYPPNAKYIAIRCVDEIMSATDYMPMDRYGKRESCEYWQEVKLELEKL